MNDIFSKQEQQRLRSSFPLFTFTFIDGDRIAGVQFTPYSSTQFLAAYQHQMNSKLTLEHAKLSLAKSLTTLYPCLAINAWLHKDGAYVSCQVVEDGRATGFAGQCDITDPNLHPWLKQRDEIAHVARQPGFFLCTGHNRAEKIEEYNYLHFAGKYCKRYGEENPAHKKAALSENYD